MAMPVVDRTTKARCRLVRASSLWLVAVWLAAPAHGSVYSNLVMSHEPVAYWRLGELSGSTAASETGSNHGTYQNNVAKGQTGAIAADSDKAANFGGGANDRVQVPGFGLSGSGITILLWFKANAFNTNDPRFVSKATSSAVADHHWMFGLNSSAANFRVRLRNTSGSVNDWSPATGGLSTGRWYFAAMTFNGSTIRVYLDGVQVASTSWSASLTTNSSVAIGLGNQPSGADSRPFNGVLDEIAVFDKALTASQIAQLYLAGGGLLGLWKLDNTSGATATDYGPYAHNGSYVNSPTLGASGPYPGEGDKAAAFNGANQWVSIPHHSRYALTSSLTISAWIKGNAWGAGTDVDTILRKGEANPTNYQLVITNGRLSLYLDGNDGSSGFVQSGTVLNTGVWYHVAGTWDGVTVRLYINGVLDTSATRTGTIGTDTRPLYIGGRFGNDDFLNGSLYDVRLYNRALSALEIAYLYGLIGNWKLAETSGTTAADSSPIANDGTYSSTTLNQTGPYPGAGSKAAQFTGGGTSFVSVPNEILYDVTDAITLALWFKADSLTKNYQTLLAKGDSAWRISRWGTQDVLHFACTGLTPNQVNGTVNINDGRWHHVVCMYDGSKLSMYVDGALDVTANSTGSISTNDFLVRIASNADKANREWHGPMHDVRVYNRALSDREISELYGLVGHWKLDETAGATATDSSGSTNHGAYQNNVTKGVAGPPLYSGNTAAQFGGGANDRVQVPAFDVEGSGISILAWFNANTFGNHRFVSKATSINAVDHFWMFQPVSNNQLRGVVRINGTTRVVEPFVSTMTAGQWYHAAMTYDGATLRVFLNGSQIGSGSWSGTVSTAPAVAVALGNQPAGGGDRAFHGKLDDVRVYNRALWPEDIQALYEAGLGGSSFPGVRIIRWQEIQ